MKRLLLMLMSIAATTAMAAPACADPAPNNDADFLKQLTDAGVTYTDPAQAVAAAKNICELADKGTPAADIKKNLEQRNSFSGNGAANFIMLAAAEYCPTQLPDEGHASKTPGTEGN
jgi:hypothetical protein